MNIIAITQARVGSSRLPSKVLKKIGTKTLLELHLERAQQAKSISKLVVATTTETGSNDIVEIANKCNASFFQGSVDDVLDRYYQAAKLFAADYIVRITSDCPLIDSTLIDDVVRFALQEGVDYVSNSLDPSFPDGQDVEVFRFAALEKAWHEATIKSDREHVTAYIWRNSTWRGGSLFTSANYACDNNYHDVRLTVDEQRDLDVIEHIVNNLGADKDWKTYASYYQAHAVLMSNTGIIRNEGYLKSLAGDN